MPSRKINPFNRWLLSLAAMFLLTDSFSAVIASDTPDPSAVTIAGDMQQELGCSADWLPDCDVTYVNYDAEDDVWQMNFDLPAGNWLYKAALNNSWAENYGLNAVRDGSNIGLNLPNASNVKFYYDHKTHWITDNVNSVIAVAPGSFQDELGCASDWDPACLRSWLQDPDGDGGYSFVTERLPAGDYEAKVAINESWDENYGAGGVSNGANIPFTVPENCAAMQFEYEPVSHLLNIQAIDNSIIQPSAATIAGSFQTELGCSGDWQPDCVLSHLNYDADDDVWQSVFAIPAGDWEYKVALNDSWDINYGANATLNGPNIGLSLAQPDAVKFYYSETTHWLADNKNSVIATLAGSFQSELGCPGDWAPDCLRSWLQDPDGDGIYTFTSTKIPVGTWEVKVAHNESWDENYGENGVPNGANIPFTVASPCAETVFSYDPVTHILTIGAVGGPRGDLNKAKAYWLTADTLAWNTGSIADDAIVTLYYAANGGLRLTQTGIDNSDDFINLTHDPAGLPGNIIDKFPFLNGYQAFKINSSSLSKVADFLKGQLAISLQDGDGQMLDATSLQIPGVLDDIYYYAGQLGIVPSRKGPTLKLWAPTAKSVKLHLFDDASAGSPSQIIPMVEDEITGVWQVKGNKNWLGKYYLYEIEVYAPSVASVVNNLVTDPYSLSLSANSTRSQIVDLNAPALKPRKWNRFNKPVLKAPEDISIYELHVRDFSITDSTVPEAHRGTFMAFVDKTSNGMRHLRKLAKAGLTHIHLLPSFDVATIPERREDQLVPEGDLSVYPPDSDMQQAAINAVADQDGFNWGYDPYHYTVPEGSYSTNPDGPTRIREFREMVEALNQSGLRVVMDVVYNHTNSAGQNDKSVLDKIVPGYYHRLNSDGAIETSSCCPNTASEHAMMEKLMIDSVITWAKDYKVDGFRFDLMGHHMRSNILKIRSALDALTLKKDGVDGSAIYLYGEGWNFGEVANNARGVNATQQNMAGTGIGTFNDRIRDGVRGGGPFSGLQEQGFINGLYYDPNDTPQTDPLGKLLQSSDWIRVSLAGNLANFPIIDCFGNLVTGAQIDYNGQAAGYTLDPQEDINYISAHDNETLFDAIQLKAPLRTSMADRVRIQNLGISLETLAQGIPFIHAGQDMLRSKSLDRNSYNSGDWFNQLDFTYETNNWGKGLPMAESNQANWPLFAPLLANPVLMPEKPDILSSVGYLKDMLSIRNSSPLFRLQTEAEVIEHVKFHNTGPNQVPGLIVMSLTDDAGNIDRRLQNIVILFNANDEAQSFQVPGFTSHHFKLHPILKHSNDSIVASANFDKSTGTFNVPGRTTAVFMDRRPLNAQLQLIINDIDRLMSEAVLSHRQAKVLKEELEKAQYAFSIGKYKSVAGHLKNFSKDVTELAHKGVLDKDQETPLISSANDILHVLYEEYLTQKKRH